MVETGQQELKKCETEASPFQQHAGSGVHTTIIQIQVKNKYSNNNK